MASHVARPVEAVREGFLEEVDPTCVRSHRQREPYWQRGSRGDVSGNGHAIYENTEKGKLERRPREHAGGSWGGQTLWKSDSLKVLEQGSHRVKATLTGTIHHLHGVFCHIQISPHTVFHLILTTTQGRTESSLPFAAMGKDGERSEHLLRSHI